MDKHYLSVAEAAASEREAATAFRITILNYTLYVAALFALIFGLMHDFGLNEIGRIHATVDYLYALCSVGIILLLRRSSDWFPIVTPVFVVLSLICFTSALIFVDNDEFRLIWFYFVIFVTYVLMGERAGMVVTAISVVIVLSCMLTLELNLSSRAMLTALVGMVVISMLSRTYSLQIRHYESQLVEKNRVLRQSIRELDGALAQAWEASQAKSLFLANMSHEIRTPLNGVLGMVQVMRGTQLDTDQQHYLDAIQRAGKNLLVLIDDLLDISRIESGKLELDPRPFSSFDWTMDVQFLTEPLFERSEVHYTTEIEESVPPWLLGDAARLTQIVTNLVSNAAKFTQQGEVRLSIGGDYSSSKRFRLRLEVSDTGVGIPEEKIDTIFESFEQVNPERIANKGVGLGLAISKRLAQAMGGDLTVRSTPGEGSLFVLEVELPVVDALRRREGVEEEELFGRQLRILLVDDDAINRLAVRTLLGQLGQQVVEAEDGEEALAQMRAAHFDLVLMDVHMPKLDGVSTTQRMRAERGTALAQMPVIGLTASVMTEERRRYLRAGMDDVVQKPVVLEQLVAAIKRQLETRGHSH
ncbi:MAG: ATP-binding protein [Pseudomonadota bacterium]